MAKPKTVFEKLTTVKKSFIKKKLGIKKIQDAKIVVLKQLKEKLKNLKDVRSQHLIIYKQWDIIMCVILASFADNNDWEDIHNFVVDNYKWLKSFLYNRKVLDKKWKRDKETYVLLEIKILK